ncbi:hypothetical protein JCM11641_002404 [Rhodosporidiobolus odoratus]
MDQDTLKPPSLGTLPPELLLLHLLPLLDSQSMTRLSQTCHTLHSITRQESVWRPLVLDLVNEHGLLDHPEQPNAAPLAPQTQMPVAHNGQQSTWYNAARFLLTASTQLGYFASSKQFTSRLIRVSVHTPPAHPSPSHDEPPSYTIHAAHLRPRNLHDRDPPRRPLPLASATLPFGALIDPILFSSYTISPDLHPSHPYTGISVDVLSPSYDFSAGMFDITPEGGATLCRAEDNAAREAMARDDFLATMPANGARAVPRSPPPPPSSPFRLRLNLEPVEQPVATLEAGFPTFPGEEEDEVEDADRQQARHRAQREAIFALYSGRLPSRPWPTLELVGLQEVDRSTLYGEQSGGTVLRASGGAFRGLHDWLTERGRELPLARVEGAEEGGTEEAFVSGFRLRPKRTPRTSFNRSPPTTTTQATEETDGSARIASAVRRRGVGMNGGAAVLWNGAEQDPDERPAVTILRAGDEADGGVILRLPGSPETADPASLPTTAETPHAHPATPVSPSLADAVDSSAEAFFPIKPPARPLSYADYSPLDEHGDIKAISLEGLWVGTYGAHGLEFVYLTVGFAEFPVGDEERERANSAVGPSQSTSFTSSTSPSQPRTRLQRLVTATKVTGDPNVPSGQTSWIALLPSSSTSLSGLSSLSSASPSSPLSDISTLLDGPVPTVSKSQFQHLSSLDPHSTAYRALNNGAGPDWTLGTARGYGRIAMTGFTTPSWTPAEVRFFREATVVRTEGEGEGEAKTLETVEEIHLKWEELHKVACFRRVRI